MTEEKELLPTEKKINEMVNEAEELIGHLQEFINFALESKHLDTDPEEFFEALYNLRYGKLNEVQKELKKLSMLMNKFFELYPSPNWAKNWDFYEDK